ncbi:glucosaminidase domain-containing protein [Pseudidiomarina taiwanensis]|uniref:Peptidoglycan hydrolase n=1 Tax=Pseudidiomarina taiwanensis TaxID=337250 RepID=A0A432ZNE4_9GAMM|nr:glucosaminidase domain-containing protein [Pseudidiomarina taiwanensis]RUO79381.1 peptidoglycan hydrolase [Pseudidiomarina taiwanensis]
MLRTLLFLFAAALIGLAIYSPRWLLQTSAVGTAAPVPAAVTKVAMVPVSAPLETDVPDFSAYQSVRDRKQAFFGFLAPLVAAENDRIEWQRLQLLALEAIINEQGLTALNQEQLQFLERLADRYRVDFEPEGELSASLSALKRRVDVVPETLVLVQAANESGWGTSRFARDALNFFGQWCFSEGCGLVPNARSDDANHEVRRFESVNASVRSYLLNINTHPAYAQLRAIREKRRLNGEEIRALDLTPGLLSYSERGEEYIAELNAMIRVNRPIILTVMDEQVSEPAAPPE